MPKTRVETNRSARRNPWPCIGLLCLVGVTGCDSVFRREVKPLLDPAELTRDTNLWDVPRASGGDRAATRPVTSRPSDAEADLSEPYVLNTQSIVKLVYKKSPLVASSRENMIAAQHGLEEFKTNLSRFEPFAKFTGNASEFPERRDSRGAAGEVTGGLEKETFDGAIVRVEGGASGERVHFGEVSDDQEEVEEGSGGLVRGRIEIPFVGSRKRQDRVISAAYQESSARGAVLTYLTQYRNYTDYALDYYSAALVYIRYVRAYENMLTMQNALLADPRIRPKDRLRIQSSAGDAKVLRDQYESTYKSYVLLVMQYLGIKPEEGYTLEEPAIDAPCPYYEATRTQEQREELLAQAFENNPKFGVLNDAIKDSELKRSQAILGKHDITAYAEGTQFAFGSETYDNRVGGWQVAGGISFRLNDQRVLTASRKKAEAEIRKYRAQIEAEQFSVRRQVAVQSAVLQSYVESRPQILDNIAKAKAEFKERRETFLSGKSSSLTIDDVLSALSSITTAEIRLASNLYSTNLAENALLTSTGEVYRIVGMKMVDQGNGIELSELSNGGLKTAGGHRGE